MKARTGTSTMVIIPNEAANPALSAIYPMSGNMNIINRLKLKLSSERSVALNSVSMFEFIYSLKIGVASPDTDEERIKNIIVNLFVQASPKILNMLKNEIMIIMVFDFNNFSSLQESFEKIAANILASTNINDICVFV